jgi:hypothetical protein
MRLSTPPLRMTPLFAWRVSASVTRIELDDAARLTGEEGREVEAARGRGRFLEDEGRVMNGLERSAADGLESVRFDGLVGEASETAFRPEASDGVRGV